MDFDKFKQFGTVRFSGIDPQMGSGFLVRDSAGIYVVTAAHVLWNFEPCKEADRIYPPELFVHFKTLDNDEVKLHFDSSRFNLGDFNDFYVPQPQPPFIPDIGTIRIFFFAHGNQVKQSDALVSGLQDQQWQQWPVFDHEELVGLNSFCKETTCYANGYPNHPMVPGHNLEEPYFRCGKLVSIENLLTEHGSNFDVVLSDLSITPGDSGGPLVIKSGEKCAVVVGVLTHRPCEKLDHTLAWPTGLIKSPT